VEPPFEFREDLLRPGQDEMVEALPLEEPQRHLGHPAEVASNVLFDVPLIPGLGPPAVVVLAGNVVDTSVRSAHPR